MDQGKELQARRKYELSRAVADIDATISTSTSTSTSTRRSSSSSSSDKAHSCDGGVDNGVSASPGREPELGQESPQPSSAVAARQMEQPQQQRQQTEEQEQGGPQTPPPSAFTRLVMAANLPGEAGGRRSPSTSQSPRPGIFSVVSSCPPPVRPAAAAAAKAIAAAADPTTAAAARPAASASAPRSRATFAPIAAAPALGPAAVEVGGSSAAQKALVLPEAPSKEEREKRPAATTAPAAEAGKC